MRLRHSASQAFLKSVSKDYIHATGSFQQIVGATPIVDDECTWLIKGPDGTQKNYRIGETIQQGDTIRLEHIATQKNLHSHEHPSPLTGQQEVTAYCHGRSGEGDVNDNWQVDLASPGIWLLGQSIRLSHGGSPKVLHSHLGYSHPTFTAGLQEVTANPRADANDWWIAEVPANPAAKSKKSNSTKTKSKAIPVWKIAVFLSHSSRDKELAKALISLLRAAVDLQVAEIRCSSVSGYKFSAGTAIDERIKLEVHECGAFIALITPNSLQSPYVLFEMGARWGNRLYIAPLIARGAKKDFLETPISGLAALFARSEEDLHQFISDLAKHLGRSVNNASSYLTELKAVIRLAKIKVSI